MLHKAYSKAYYFSVPSLNKHILCVLNLVALNYWENKDAITFKYNTYLWILESLRDILFFIHAATVYNGSTHLILTSS